MTTKNSKKKTVARRRKPQTKTATCQKIRTVRDMLDVIDGFLCNPIEHPLYSEGVKLWSVLSALRGPDDEDCTVKVHTTGYIRRAAFPRTAAGRFNSAKAKASFLVEGPFNPNDGGSSHFQDHIRGAADALGFCY